MESEGIFRVASGVASLSVWQKEFDENRSATFPPQTDPLLVASFLKSYLRQLPNPLLTFDLYTLFLQAGELEDEKEQMDATQRLLEKLPRSHTATACVVFGLLHRLAKHSAKNRMTPANLAICLGPSLLRPMSDNTDSVMTEIGLSAQTVAFLIRQQPRLFGEAAGHDSLPSPL